MSRYTELVARAEQHLATAETAADDPHVAAQCALAAAILAGRPRPLRSRIDLEAYLTDTEGDTRPQVAAGRAVAAAVQAAGAELDEIEVDDCGFPANA